jgi:hypothetical protein
MMNTLRAKAVSLGIKSIGYQSLGILRSNIRYASETKQLKNWVTLLAVGS